MGSFEALLLARALVTPVELARAVEVSKRAAARLPATLVGLGLLSEVDLASTMAESHGLALVSREAISGERPYIEGLNKKFLTRHAVLPLTIDKGCLRIAMADPSDVLAINGVRFAAGVNNVDIVVASFADIDEAIGREAESDPSALIDFATGSDDADLARLLEGDSEAPVIRLVQRLLAGAVNRRASDVHIEPMAREVVVRYRIDGRLIDIERLGDGLAEPVASRVKVMAGLDIAETRLPQDGRLRITVRGRDVDVRVSTSPIAHGESIVLRLLGRNEVPLDLDRLGLPDAALETFKRALNRPHGIILLTGPTGSGKTTTLYAAINRLRRPDVKILTVEDPVEVLLDGINQVQVRPEIGLTYAATLRAFLRQDPDILMIGEIRDRETADIAMRAALTGHLVLSTLHTNTAIGAYTRLADIGIEPYLSASTVIATIAQRLVRSLCLDCSVPRVLSHAERVLFEQFSVPVPGAVKDPVGCHRCQETGYRGRLPLLEIVEVDDELRTAIHDGKTASYEAHPSPVHTLRGHGLAVVAAGLTTLAEIERAVELK